MTPTAPFSVTARRTSFDRFRHDLRRDDGGVLDAIAALFAEIVSPIVVGFRQFDGEVEFAHESDG